MVQSTQLSEDPHADLADRVFSLFANLCLFASCVWHVMAGCAHRKAMETAARIDYVGIGWYVLSVSYLSIIDTHTRITG